MTEADKNTLEMDIQLGEGQYIEFKESLDSKFPKELADKLNKERTTIYRNIKKMIELNQLKREGGRKLGRWIVIKK